MSSPRLFCRFLSAPENRKEPNGLSELVWTQRVHDVICGSGTAVSHCVIVFSCSSLVSHIFCAVGQTQGHMSVYILLFFLHASCHTGCLRTRTLSSTQSPLVHLLHRHTHVQDSVVSTESQNHGQNCRICQEKRNILLTIEHIDTLN